MLPENYDHTNIIVFTNGKRGFTKNAMLSDDIMFADIWEHLQPALTTSTEAFFILLGKPNEKHRKNSLSVDKHYDILCSFICKQLVILKKLG